MTNYEKWLNYPDLDQNLKNELLSLTDQQKEDAFHMDLEFGTGGMRGILGVGTNRMNIYIIRKATYGFGQYLGKGKSVVISYDNRHFSKEFALETAKVLASMEIKAYLVKELRPTPFLSFAIRYLKADGGIMITASHNPKEYNGYKIYDENGCQLTPNSADQVINEINQIKDYFRIETKLNHQLITYLNDDVDFAYLDMVKKIQINQVNKHFKIIYTPLHGTGSVFVPTLLKSLGYDVHALKEEMLNDPDFKAVQSANPEDSKAFINSIIKGKEIQADILIATDPDADRMGIAVYDKGEYKLLTGNQIAAVLLKYILDNNHKIKKGGYVITTNVSSSLAVEIAKKYGMSIKIVLTGFKYIGEQAEEIHKQNGHFVFGFEESYGYLISDEVRDKDAIQACLMISEACGHYKALNKTLFDCLEDIYQEYGYYLEDLINMTLKGISGSEKINTIMEYFRNSKLTGFPIKTKEDYEKSIAYEKNSEHIIDLPKSNVIKYILEDDSWFVLRPSGTEPKLKVYFGVKDSTKEKALYKINSLKSVVSDIINRI